MLPIIDAHQHLWDTTRLQLAWLPKEGPLAGDHTLTDYQREAEGLNIVRTLYMEVDVAPEQIDLEADTVLQLCRQPESRMVGGVIRGVPGTDQFAAHVEKYSHEPAIKGFRQVLHGDLPAGTCLQDAFVRDMRLLGERGLCFDLCMRPAELKDAARLAELCPETKFVLDHCGNAEVQTADRSDWERDMALVAKQPNVVCKISGIVARARPGAWTADDLAPIVNHCHKVFGAERLIWASDWPVCTVAATLRQWVEASRAIASAWPEAEQRKLFHDNAVRFYALR